MGKANKRHRHKILKVPTKCARETECENGWLQATSGKTVPIEDQGWQQHPSAQETRETLCQHVGLYWSWTNQAQGWLARTTRHQNQKQTEGKSIRKEIRTVCIEITIKLWRVATKDNKATWTIGVRQRKREIATRTDPPSPKGTLDEVIEERMQTHGWHYPLCVPSLWHSPSTQQSSPLHTLQP